MHPRTTMLISNFYYEFLLLGLVSTLLLLLYVLYVRIPVDAAYLRTGLSLSNKLCNKFS